MSIRSTNAGARHRNERRAILRTDRQARYFGRHPEAVLVPVDRGVWTEEINVRRNQPGFEDAADLAKRCEEGCNFEVAANWMSDNSYTTAADKRTRRFPSHYP